MGAGAPGAPFGGRGPSRPSELDGSPWSASLARVPPGVLGLPEIKSEVAPAAAANAPSAPTAPAGAVGGGVPKRGPPPEPAIAPAPGWVPEPSRVLEPAWEVEPPSVPVPLAL